MPMPYPPQNYNPQFDAERIRKATKVSEPPKREVWGWDPADTEPKIYCWTESKLTR